MNVEELRIGNYFTQSEGKQEPVFIVLELKDIIIYDGLNMEIGAECYYNYAYGIPLTEKWLKKFGHSHTNGNWIISAGKTYQGKTELYVYKMKGEWHVSLGGGLTWRKLKYVHTYQNFYFAITDKELTIKNK